MKSIKDIKILKGKTVLLRADFNVPIKDGKIGDSFRILKTVPTINALTKKGARVVVVSHAGSDGAQSLLPMVKILRKHIPNTVFIPKTTLTKYEVNSFPEKSVIVLENLRLNDGEVSNNSLFAKALSLMADIYVNDAFSVSHRAHASVVGVPKHLPSYAGLQLIDEVKHLSLSFNPKHPFLFILGGAKFSTKLPLIKKFVKSVDSLFIGGALANQVFKEQGFETGVSLVEKENYNLVALCKNKKIHLPVDVLAVNKKGAKRIVGPHALKADENMLDIGSETTKLLTAEIKKAKFILWNGPVGKFDTETKKLLKVIANGKATSIIGGGDTVEVVSKMKMEKDFTFVSTGGGATLEFLASGTLPGIKALK
jgi:phosphoglycerate kinase